MENRFLTIDRFEGRLAVLEREDGSFISVLRSFLPPSAAEGSVLVHGAQGWAVCTEETKRRREQVRALEDELFL